MAIPVEVQVGRGEFRLDRLELVFERLACDGNVLLLGLRRVRLWDVLQLDVGVS